MFHEGIPASKAGNQSGPRATFKHPGLNQTTGYNYSRIQNPINS